MQGKHFEILDARNVSLALQKLSALCLDLS